MMYNNDNLSDEEKSFNEWLEKTNVPIVDIPILRKTFLDGFAAGWEHSKKYSAKEWLEK